MNKLFNTIVVAQAAYIFITGIWPLIDINSFMTVTGKKTDIWLVKTVGAVPQRSPLYALTFIMP